MFSVMSVEKSNGDVVVYDTDDAATDLATQQILSKLSVEIEGKHCDSEGTVSFEVGDICGAVQRVYDAYKLKSLLLNNNKIQSDSEITLGYDDKESMSGVLFTTDRVVPYIPNGVTFLQSRYNSTNVHSDAYDIPRVTLDDMLRDNEYEVLELPITVRVLKAYTFVSSSALKKIVLNRGLLRIDSYAFANSAALLDINIPDTVYSLGEGAFACCVAMQRVKLSDSLVHIQKSTFFWCYHLSEIIGIEHIRTVDEEAFSYCNSLSSVRLQAVSTIRDSGFSRSGLEQVELGEQLKVLGNSAFYQCSHLKKVQFKGTLLKTISENCFASCSRLETVQLSQGVKTIGVSAFDGCCSLSDIVLPDTVERIEAYAFKRCFHLTKLKLPKSVIQLGRKVFEGVSFESLFVPIHCRTFGWGTNLEKDLTDARKQVGDSLLGSFSCRHLSIPFGIFYKLYSCDAIEFLYPYHIQTLELRADDISEQVQDKQFNVIVPETLQTLRLKGIQSKFRVKSLTKHGAKVANDVKIEYC